MSGYVISKNRTIHRVVEDDGHRMVLENPSGSRINVTKSRHKFTPLSVVRSTVHDLSESVANGGGDVSGIVVLTLAYKNPVVAELPFHAVGNGIEGCSP